MVEPAFARRAGEPEPFLARGSSFEDRVARAPVEQRRAGGHGSYAGEAPEGLPRLGTNANIVGRFFFLFEPPSTTPFATLTGCLMNDCAFPLRPQLPGSISTRTIRSAFDAMMTFPPV
jgi:hypothetical protein